MKAARQLRDSTITVLLAEGVRVTEIADICAVSVSHVKLVKRIKEQAAAS